MTSMSQAQVCQVNDAAQLEMLQAIDYGDEVMRANCAAWAHAAQAVCFRQMAERAASGTDKSMLFIAAKNAEALCRLEMAKLGSAKQKDLLIRLFGYAAI